MLLILDDNQDDCELMKAALEKVDPTLVVDVCRGPEKALSLLLDSGTWLPRVLLLDLDLKHRLDGHDVLRELRSHPRTRTLPIVVVTGLREDEGIVRSYELLANSYVQKPNTGGELSELMERVGLYWGRMNSIVQEEDSSSQASPDPTSS